MNVKQVVTNFILPESGRFIKQCNIVIKLLSLGQFCILAMFSLLWHFFSLILSPTRCISSKLLIVSFKGEGFPCPPYNMGVNYEMLKLSIFKVNLPCPFTRNINDLIRKRNKFWLNLTEFFQIQHSSC